MSGDQTSLYTAEATASAEGRNGSARSSDGQLDVRLTIPEELGGPGGEGTNPEQLFAAGYAACFTSALKTVARKQRIDPGSVSVTARVGLIRLEDGYGLTVELAVTLPDLSQDVAETLVRNAHQTCPYSNATRGNIPVTLSLDGNAVTA
jgi:osmotically inducible protein OsmC